ncbi:N amino acid transport system protein [Leucoagaricus sp. SymC.cos]|nr:N amino acid transport system protein [Leucoagaricus sp. SymC.cos]
MPEIATLLTSTGGVFHNAHNFVIQNPIFQEVTPSSLDTWTRLSTIEETRSFCSVRLPSKRLLWIVGPAGVGKSAIMQTVAETCPNLGASLFFSVNRRNDPTKIIATLAYQLATKHKQYCHYVHAHVTNSPDLMDKSMAALFEVLIAEPLAKHGIYQGEEPLVIFIDGVDECDGIAPQRKLVELISSLITKYPSAPLVWVLASRPEPHITTLFESFSMTLYHKIELSVQSNKSREDVEKFLRDSFAEIHPKYGALRFFPRWPTEEQFLKIITAASGLFAYGATAIRFIDDPEGGNPQSRLELLLEVIDNVHAENADGNDDETDMDPMAQLDALYDRIISRIPKRGFRKTLGLLSASGVLPGHPQGGDQLAWAAEWLRMTPDVAFGSLHHLHSVLHVPQTIRDALQNRVKAYHKLFKDYLVKSFPNATLEYERIIFENALAILRDVPPTPNPTKDGSFPPYIPSSIPFVDSPEKAIIRFRFVVESMNVHLQFAMTVHRQVLLDILPSELKSGYGPCIYGPWEKWGHLSRWFILGHEDDYVTCVNGQRYILSDANRLRSSKKLTLLDFNRFSVKRAIKEPYTAVLRHPVFAEPLKSCLLCTKVTKGESYHGVMINDSAIIAKDQLSLLLPLVFLLQKSQFPLLLLSLAFLLQNSTANNLQEQPQVDEKKKWYNKLSDYKGPNVNIDPNQQYPEVPLTQEEEERAAASRSMRLASWASVFYLITTDILGPYNAPFAISQVGWVPVALVALYTSLILWRLFVRLDSIRYPLRSYSDIVERIYGKRARQVASFLQNLQLIIIVGVNCLANGQAFSQVTKGRICFSVCIVIWTLIGMVIGQVRSLKWYIRVNITLIAVSMGFVAHSPPNFEAAQKSLGVKPGPVVTQKTASLPLFLQVTGIMNMVFAYGGAMIFPEIMAEMRRPMDFWKGMPLALVHLPQTLAQLFIFCVYILYGAFIYSFQGQFALPLAYQGVSRFEWQTVGNVLSLLSLTFATGLYGNIATKIIYRSVIVEYFKGPPLMSRNGYFIWAGLVCLYWAIGTLLLRPTYHTPHLPPHHTLAFVIGSAIPQVQTIIGLIASIAIMQFTYTFPPLLRFGYDVITDAMVADKPFVPGKGTSGRADGWNQWSRWKRGLFGGQWYFKLFNLLIGLAGLAMACLGMWGSGKSIKMIFDTAGSATSFGCTSPV